MAERALSAAGFGLGAVRERLRVLALGSLTGVVAGMGTFMFLQENFLPWGVTETWALGFVVAAGAYTHFLAADLSESIALSLVAVVVGLATNVVAWIGPLWILGYPRFARGLLLPKMVGEALASGLPTYLITFYAAYFGALTLGGYLEA
ncbi:hypothetical protein [Halorussus caseinilyticus]|uniref:ABC transporter permease n=1 Tax=Halorussus caseinilyticus TaxID=3034025 RepID=A0ABD5WJA9_9EURY|nr:hypothetical protein [Halorussus sp. DT72]